MILGMHCQASAADFSEAQSLFYKGEYEKCSAACAEEVEKGIWNDAWYRLLIKCYLTTGKYPEAKLVYEKAAAKFTSSIPLIMQGADVFRFNNEPVKAKSLLEQIPALVQTQPWRFSDRENMVALGRYFLATGEDAREVLDIFYDRTLKVDPKFVEAHIATAELALEKADYAEAVKSLKKASDIEPNDPRIQYLLAVAWSASDVEQTNASLTKAAELNPRMPELYLFQAESLIDGEQYAAAEEALEKVTGINPAHPECWALRAVIAHLRGEYEKEGEYRLKGLEVWKLNPLVDHVIGKKLSRHYRFADGVRYQRQALRMDPKYVPARFQLAQDLLRVGEDDEGWTIVDQVSSDDKYNIQAFNLRTLQTRLRQFTTIEAPGFVVRMDSREAKIYGQRVVRLLSRAREVLCKKYDMLIQDPVAVEIFPQQSDFAIRTFGLPGGAGFLGVCFGKLITANSPASQGDSPSNWESVLWHEYCHVVTLQKTNNRMPRWLSEGISVYEELQTDPTWGQSMTPTYRQMILGKDFFPLSKLSSAFLRPKSGMHLQFAYFESYLAVKYLVEKHGAPRLNRLLVDLGIGMPIDEALVRSFGALEALDEDFEKYAKEAARALAPQADFDTEKLPEKASLVGIDAWVAENPKNFFGLKLLARRQIEAEHWQDAILTLGKLRDLHPTDKEPGNVYEMLARVYRELKDTSHELDNLQKLAELTGDSVPCFQRLIELFQAKQDWHHVAKYANRLLAVQPLIAGGHQALSLSSQHLNQPAEALPAIESLLALEPLDAAQLHFQLAELSVKVGQPTKARREVLIALEESPRYRAAQKLLVELVTQAQNVPLRVSTPDVQGKPPEPARVGQRRGS